MKENNINICRLTDDKYVRLKTSYISFYPVIYLPYFSLLSIIERANEIKKATIDIIKFTKTTYISDFTSNSPKILYAVDEVAYIRTQ